MSGEDCRFLDLLCGQARPSLKSQEDSYLPVWSTEQLRFEFIDNYSPLYPTDRLPVKSAWYYRQTNLAKHEFIVVEFEFEDVGKWDMMRVNYLVLGRNILDKPTGSVKGFGRFQTFIQGEQAVDTFRASYDGSLDHLLSDCNLQSHKLVEHLQFSLDKPLYLYELVVLANVVSMRHPIHRAIGSNPFIFVGLIWDTLCYMCPDATLIRPSEKERRKTGWFRYTIDKSEVQDVRSQASGEIEEAQLRFEKSKKELDDLIQARLCAMGYFRTSSSDPKATASQLRDSVPSSTATTSKEAAQSKATRDVEEYLDVQDGDISTAVMSLESLPAEYHYLFITVLGDAAVERGEGSIVLAEKLLAAICERAVVPSEALKRGLLLTIEAADEQSAETSRIYEWIFRLLVSADLIHTRKYTDWTPPDSIAKELVKEFFEIHQAGRNESHGSQATISSTRDNAIALALGGPSSPSVPDLANSQRKFKITAETSLDDIVNYFEQVAGLDNYTSKLDHDQPLDQRGRGGCADVYRVSTTSGSYVAVKCIAMDRRAGNDKTLKRTARELEVWSRLKHENILPLLGLAKFKNCVAMVSNWMDEGNVVSYVNSHPEKDRYRLSAQIVGAVVYLHSQVPEIVHGDIKGDNVLISPDGEPRLTDFGLTIMAESNLILSATDAGGGTMRWMAPELFKEDGCRSKEADVYALGMTILETLTGKPPFDEIRSTWGVQTAVLSKRTPQRPKELSPPSKLNESFWNTMAKCWIYEPTKRGQVTEIENLLVNALQREETDASTKSQLPNMTV